MDFEDYQHTAWGSARYPNRGSNPVFPTLGLAGEAGEIANLVKKIWRDHEGEVSVDDRRLLAAELGDALWYLSQLATELHISLGDIAELNLAKIRERYQKAEHIVEN